MLAAILMSLLIHLFLVADRGMASDYYKRLLILPAIDVQLKDVDKMIESFTNWKRQQNLSFSIAFSRHGCSDWKCTMGFVSLSCIIWSKIIYVPFNISMS